ncbi:MAG TPA: protein kinase [Abditibacteriaceae bacterium]|nr:protein kinase [Abditibacteriaceae bacterium]
MICPSCNLQNREDALVCDACGSALPQGTLPTFTHALPPATKLNGGEFIVEAVLGQGGFGITYLCTTTHLQTSVAIKEFFPTGCARTGVSVVPAGGWNEPAFAGARLRFVQEAETLARLSHPGLVRVLQCFEENATAYIVMEYVPGRSLAELLQESGGALDEAHAIAIIEQIGRALEPVHEAGLLHRDIKPDNIIVTPAARAVLIDFGTMRAFAAGQAASMTVMMTPGYAPLEQYARRARFGPYTDVYALAATLYHLLTGEMPVAATDRAAGVELPHVRELRPHVRAAVAEAVMEGLAMEVSKRPPSARAFLSWLARGSAFVMPLSSTPPRGFTPAHVLSLAYGSQSTVAFAPDGHTLACGCSDATIRLWDMNTGQLVQTIKLGDEVGDVAFSPAGDVLASAKWEEVALWSPHEGKLLRLLHGHRLWVSSLAFAPDGVVLASASAENTIKLWEVETGKLLRTLEALHAATAVAYSPDGLWLASGGADKAVRIWNTRTGMLEQMLLGHRDKVTSVAFASDGATLASASCDSTVKIWDATHNFQAGKLLGTLEHSGAVSSVTFSPDSRLLAFGSYDKTVRLWDAQTGDLLETLHGHTDKVTSVAFAPNGRTMASGSLDKTIRLWRPR